MYTEENDFNYDDYLDEDDKFNSNNSFFNFNFIMKVILIIILLIIIMFLVFKIINNGKNNDSNSTKEENNKSLVISDNLAIIRDASRVYFFDNNNLPSDISGKKFVNVQELINKGLIGSVKDKNGNYCGYNTSGSTITKNQNDYQLDVKTICLTGNETKTYYYDINGKCLNCNGESYIPSENDEENDDIIDDDNQKEDNIKEDDKPSNDDKKENLKTCTEFSAWTTEYKSDSNLEVEQRVLYKAYKVNTIYGNWSNPTENKITGNDNLEVRVIEETSPTTTTTCSEESTVKPESKDGREITSREETKTTTKRVCTGGGTYYKTLTRWDNNAYSCQLQSIGKVVCTYKEKEECYNKTINNTVTYYKYCDTTTTNIQKTLYQSRSITYEPVYTDYILASQVPSGYTLAESTKLVQYRYREKCSK